jgi:hypothetical protein
MFTSSPTASRIGRRLARGLAGGSLLLGLSLAPGCSDADWADFAAGISEGLQPETQPRLDEATFLTKIEEIRAKLTAGGYQVMHSERGQLFGAGTNTVQIPPFTPNVLHNIVAISDGATLTLNVTDQFGRGPYPLNFADGDYPHTRSVVLQADGAVSFTAVVGMDQAAFNDNAGPRNWYVFLARKVR